MGKVNEARRCKHDEKTMGKFNLRRADVKTMNFCYLIKGRDEEDSHMHHS